MNYKVTAKEVIDLVRRLPDADLHIHYARETPSITNEWLCGAFAGRGFTASTLEEAADKLINYLDKHIGHNSMVGNSVTESGWPDLEKVEAYCQPVIEDE